MTFLLWTRISGSLKYVVGVRLLPLPDVRITHMERRGGMMLPRQAGVTAFVLTVLAFAGLTSATSAVMSHLTHAVRAGAGRPCQRCGDKCRTFISAVGAITKDTPSDFAAFARDRDVTGATLVLDSSGGSTSEPCARPQHPPARRQHHGRQAHQLPPVGAGAARVALSPRADRESMCADPLLSGSNVSFRWKRRAGA